MRWNGFGRSVGFAALAAGASVVWLLLVSPVVGGRAALALAITGLAAGYLGGLADGLRRRVGTCLVAGAIGCTLCALAPGLRELALALAVLIGVGRSGFLFRTPPAQAVVVELVLGIGGFAFAGALGDRSLLGVGFAVWGYFLVQSLYFLVPGRRARVPVPTRDPFGAACAKAAALLDRGR